MAEKEFIERLEKLERDNRRLKGFAIAAVILAAALGAIFAAQPVPDKITAHEFDVVDGAGRVRAWLGVTRDKAVGKTTGPAHPELAMADADGHRTVILHGEDAYTRTVSAQGGTIPVSVSPGLDVTSVRDGRVTDAMVSVTGIDVVAGDFGGGSPTGVETADLSVNGIQVHAKEPEIALADDQGFTMDLGSTSTVISRTGETSQTSAASIVMFGNDKDHHVIWKAP